MPETIDESFESYLTAVLYPVELRELEHEAPRSFQALRRAYHEGVMFAVTEALKENGRAKIDRLRQLQVEVGAYKRANPKPRVNAWD